MDFSPLEGGQRHQVLRGTGDGSAYVFKTTNRSEAQLAWLATLEPRLKSVGLARALPIPTLEGACSFAGWTVERYIPGRVLTPADRVRLRQTLRRMQRVCFGLPQRPGFLKARDFLVQSKGGDIDLSRMPEDVVKRCRKALSLVPSVPVTLCHGDLHPGNIAVTPWGQFVFYDWDEARIDNPLFDMVAVGALDHPTPRRAALAYEIAACWHIEPERAKSLLLHL
ncbi:phosphotransferase [Primorskyibacter sp. S187A]|uniref:phosphotransferase n=1 Tax=Primorskyibacter sp. S187A TaxID=3415130 RepID=UPI003C7B6831